MGKKKAPAQPTTKTDMGLFGWTTTGSFGSTFNPTDFQKTFVNNAENAMLNAQNAYNNREVAQEADWLYVPIWFSPVPRVIPSWTTHPSAGAV